MTHHARRATATIAFLAPHRFLSRSYNSPQRRVLFVSRQASSTSAVRNSREPSLVIASCLVRLSLCADARRQAGVGGRLPLRAEAADVARFGQHDLGRHRADAGNAGQHGAGFPLGDRRRPGRTASAACRPS